MGKALYRAYRSRSFDEVVGQDHIVRTLKNSLKNNAISHAYLLTGPRGVGKTSIARILAFAVNNLDYQEDIPHLDIIEIDAASNRRIDEVREIRERVRIAPTSAKYKVYIVDEVHMLTREAFNALLKTLEEPPAHAIFILATTELHKVPETIVSRCIRLTFKPIEHSLLSAHLANIAKKEGYKINSEAIDLIAHHGRGSFRDGISLLQQVASSGSAITKDDVEHLLGIAPDAIIHGVIEATESGSTASLQEALTAAYDFGANEATLASQLSEYCRNLIVEPSGTTLSSQEIIQIQRGLLSVVGSPKPRTELELVLLDVLLARAAIPAKGQLVQASSTAPPQKKSPQLDSKPQVAKELEQKKEAPTKERVKDVSSNVLEHDVWPSVLEALKKKNNTLYGIARMGQVEQAGNVLEITFTFPFHYKQVNDAKNKAIFAAILNDISGGVGELVIRQGSAENAPQTITKKQDDTLTNVSNIFGAAEMLES